MVPDDSKNGAPRGPIGLKNHREIIGKSYETHRKIIGKNTKIIMVIFGNFMVEMYFFNILIVSSASLWYNKIPMSLF